MKNKHVGFLVIGVAVFFFFIVMSFNNALGDIVDETCTHGDFCPMQTTLKTQKVVSYSLMALLLALGTFLLLFMKEESSTVVIHKQEKVLGETEKKKKLNDLVGDEKKIMEVLLREEGSVYQSDLIKETKLTKVKVSRVLDKLEGKGLIERKRRGMTNIIVLK
jgi:uncharacterized membrane protein